MNTQRSPTGIPGLDEQYLLEGLRLGERCSYITLSETTRELQAGARSHGWSLDGIEVVELVPDEEELGEDQLSILPASEVEFGQTIRRVLEAIERSGPRRMVFDSLSELRLLAQTSLRYRRQVLALKQFFAGRRCTMLMIDDRNGDGPDLQLHSIAHGVVALESSAPAYGELRRELRVVKFRGSDFITGFHDFTVRRGGLTVYPRLVAAEHPPLSRAGLLSSGVAALDSLMGGGIDRGTSTLLVGPPGGGSGRARGTSGWRRSPGFIRRLNRRTPVSARRPGANMGA